MIAKMIQSIIPIIFNILTIFIPPTTYYLFIYLFIILNKLTNISSTILNSIQNRATLIQNK